MSFPRQVRLSHRHNNSNLTIANVHIVSGSHKSPTENHRIPGKTEQARNDFKAMCVRKVLERLLEGPGASQGDLKLMVGDLNMKPAAMKECLDKSCRAIRALHYMHGRVDELRSTYRCLEARDWLIGNFHLAAEPSHTAGGHRHNAIVAHDGQHMAVIAQWDRSGWEEWKKAQAAKPQGDQETRVALEARLSGIWTVMSERSMAMQRQAEQEQMLLELKTWQKICKKEI